MIAAPKTLPIETSIASVQAAFENSHVHMVLLTRDDVLYGALLRADLPMSLPPRVAALRLALRLATLKGRTILPDERIAAAHGRLVRSGQRRLAVVDGDNGLLGLLCLKRDQTGFCTNDGVAARRSTHTPPAPQAATRTTNEPSHESL